jgi:hypothetical protein
MGRSAPGPPAARQCGAAMLATAAVLLLIVACPSSSLVVWTFLAPLVSLLLIGLVVLLAPRGGNSHGGELNVWGWLTFCCGVLATTFFVVRAVGAATLGGSNSGANLAFFLVVAGCWWPGGVIALLIWALEEWLLEPGGRARCWAQLQAGLVAGAWGLIVGLGWLLVFPPTRF